MLLPPYFSCRCAVILVMLEGVLVPNTPFGIVEQNFKRAYNRPQHMLLLFDVGSLRLLFRNAVCNI